MSDKIPDRVVLLTLLSGFAISACKYSKKAMKIPQLRHQLLRGLQSSCLGSNSSHPLIILLAALCLTLLRIRQLSNFSGEPQNEKMGKIQAPEDERGEESLSPRFLHLSRSCEGKSLTWFAISPQRCRGWMFLKSHLFLFHQVYHHRSCFTV